MSMSMGFPEGCCGKASLMLVFFRHIVLDLSANCLPCTVEVWALTVDVTGVQTGTWLQNVPHDHNFGMPDL